MILIFIMIFFIFILSIIYSAEYKFNSISGTVMDETGKPIENVSILIDKSNVGTSTDQSGYFSIQVEEDFNNIIFSHIAYEKLKIELPPMNKKPLTVILKNIPIKIDELVITSNRKETYIKDTPIITHVITKDDINKTGYSTVKETIEFAMPGIQSTHDNHGEGKIKIQGLDNKYTAFLVDGNKVTGESAGNIDFSLFNINNIERIEIIKGGLSTVYGSGAIGGVINIITENSAEKKWINFNSIYDRPKIFSNSLGFGFRYKKIMYSGNMNYSTTNGYDLTPVDLNSGEDYLAINKTLEEYSSMLLDQTIKFNLNNQTTISLSYKYYLKNIYKYQFINNTNTTYLQDELPVFESKNAILNYKKTLDNNSFIAINYQIENYLKSYYYPYYYENDNSYTINGNTFLWSNPITTSSSILYNTKLNKHQLLLGIDYVYQEYSSTNIFDSNESSIITESIFGENGNKNINETSIFILDNFNYHDIQFNVGARLSSHSKYKSRISPSISIMKAINSYNYRINFSQNYRTPSLKEIYYSYEGHPGLPVYGNENLKPSISNYYSLSIESRKYINNSIEFYYNNVTDMILFDLTDNNNDQIADIYQYFNEKHVDLYGLNISLRVASIQKIIIQSVYTYTQAKSDYKEVIDGISAHAINMKLKYNPLKNWEILLASKFNSSKIVDTNLPNINDNRNDLVLPAYTISNISITKNFKYGNYLKIGIKNIFDYIDKNSNPDFQDFLTTYEPGRRFFISMNFKLSKGYNE